MLMLPSCAYLLQAHTQPHTPDSKPHPACRYNLPICIVVINNGGIYGGDRRQQALVELAETGTRGGSRAGGDLW